MLSLGAASSRVLSTPELLDHILFELERDDLVELALVDLLWADIARNHIWRVVTVPCQLFRILAPLKTHEPEHIFLRAPTSSDWQHFLRISCRVRELQMDDNDNFDVDPCTEFSCMGLIDAVARTRPIIDIFPKLTRLGWWDIKEPYDHSERINSLLSSNLKTLELFSPTGSEWYTADALFDDIIYRCPRLQNLHIIAGSAAAPPYANIQEGISRVLNQLSLRQLELPLYYISTRILAAASQCSSLRDLAIRHAIWFSSPNVCGNYNDARDLHFPELRAGSFANLTSFYLAACLAPLTRMLQDPHFSGATMGIFRLRAVQSESNDTIAALLSVLFDRCQGMNVLVLHLARPRRRQELEIDSDNDEESDEEEPTWTPPPRREFLRWSTLQQLHFPELTRLEITHEYALAISDDNITVLARNLRNLEVLDLNAAPGNADAGAPRLSLRCLYPLAMWLHRLMDLALLLDATLALDPGSPIARFQRLECLFLCTSPIQETERETTTLYLARVLPTDAILTSDREYVSEWDYTPPVFEPERRAIWKRIETDLRLILNAKRDWLKDALQQDSQTVHA